MESRPSNKRPQAGESAFLHELAMAAHAEKGAVMHYTHAAILAADKNPAAARLFDELARVELAHYEELGQLLLYLDKYLPQGTRSAWRNVFFTKNPHTVQKNPPHEAHFIEYAITTERDTAANYRRLADMTNDDVAHKLLLHLSSEEAGHATALEGLQERMQNS